MMESGWKGRPLIAIPLGRGYYQAVTGSHRHAAAIEASLPRIPILPFDEKEMKVVLRSEGYDPDQERIFSPAIVSEALEKRGHKGIGNLLRMDVMTAIMEIQHPEAVPWSKEAIAYYKTTSFNDPAAIKVMAVETWPC